MKQDVFSYYSSALTEAGALVKKGPIVVSGFRLENANSTICYVQFFDAEKLSDVTVGTTAPDFAVMVPGGGVASLEPNRFPIYFKKGLVVAATAGRSNNTAPADDPGVHIYHTRA